MASIGGKLPMTAQSRSLLSDKMFQGMSMIMAPRGFGAIVHSLEFPQKPDPEFATRWPAFVDALDHDSIGWGVWGARRNFPKDPSMLDGEDLHALVLDVTRGWHPNLRRLIQLTPPSAAGYIGIRTSVPPAPWPGSNVTLLGDAIHTMTPGRGAGANTALRDAVLLSGMLIDTDQGRRTLAPAIREYEAEMLRYSAEAVRESKKQMNASDMIHRPVVGRVQLAAMRGAMRVVDAIPALKRKVLQNILRVRGEN
jgi:2-polyprenyl-6-methoxyphenol hydroxylase-like FAD-dependent oxidoreductase